MTNPREAYSRLLDQRRAEIASREERHRLLGYGRLAAVAAAAIVAFVASLANALHRVDAWRRRRCSRC